MFTKQDALWEVLESARETKRASESGLLDLSEQKKLWREAVERRPRMSRSTISTFKFKGQIE